MILTCLLITMVMSLGVPTQASLAASPGNEERAWKVYTNARFGFSVRYPEHWRLGNPISDGVGVTLHPPIDNSLVALSGHMNVLEGKSQDGRHQEVEVVANLYQEDGRAVIHGLLNIIDVNIIPKNRLRIPIVEFNRRTRKPNK